MVSESSSSAWTLVIGGGAVAGLAWLYNRKRTVKPVVKQYLTNTYSYVAGELVVTGATAYAAKQLGVTRWIVEQAQAHPIAVALVGTAVPVGLMLTTLLVDKRDKPAKHAALAATCVGMGVVLSPISYIPSRLVVPAAAMTAGIVGSLSAVAIGTNDLRFLYLAGPLSMGVTTMALANLFSRFTGDAATDVLDNFNLYGGLVIFGGYVLFDTHNAISNALLKDDPDYINESFSLYGDVINIFVKLLRMLIKAEEEKDKRRRRGQW
eukprot:TRINITY_DN18434_c0_g1_i1.p1 TRINITY_DN18434_c0_g1~~TRINITY_DN18434_c0_g1_i1.p1  ORF type:complete len:265 (+),score=97.25 TRINITY_DN18434_c0_g1_i1:173-967(+)